MPHASAQQPTAATPLRPLWYAKDVRHPFPGITRVVVPLAGGPPPPGAEEHVTRALEQTWVTPPAGLPYANAIAVSIDTEPRAMDGRAYWLVLVISSTGNCAPLHIDRMARHLRAALAQLTPADPLIREAPTPPPPSDTNHVRELLEAQLTARDATASVTKQVSRRVTRLHHAQEAIRAARSHARGTVRSSDPT